MYFKNAKPTTVETVSQFSCSARLISSAALDENFQRIIPEHNLFRAASVSQVGIAHPLQYIGWCVEIFCTETENVSRCVHRSWLK